MVCGSAVTDHGAHVAVPGPELVDLRLGNVGSLFSLIKLVLNLPALCLVVVGLFLLESRITAFHSFSLKTQAAFPGFPSSWSCSRLTVSPAPSFVSLN